MNILVIADAQRFEELQQKGLAKHEVQWKTSLEEVLSIKVFDLVIDLIFDDRPEHAAVYAKNPGVPVLAGMVKTSLAEVMNQYAFEQGFNIVGCNFLPGFIRMPVTEVTVLDDEQKSTLDQLMYQLNWEYAVVADHVGMVTPLVVCMIINEAYLTAAEGTASREDIDISMKLGTNYPFGPFEWCEMIGVKHVYEVLKAAQHATGDDRYEAAALLQTEYEAI
ncbi:3-hydroxyacyl-CoA dehydrogenase family protein [Chitinophaga nivalis]|uniref:3-hydroxyacyl-CoA dehydrogenase family protein n=1 Tax=Chitinophaga nivalis TaxID=2991709 RepID=A0ABT3IVT8_9BACT|nr:3-hydroxyacyl-CoA dehydrogenase family protein [Chitinophaga nivalis]MCW3462206.1 3-hydroxyacyl-CoA dehydrogenase family protein [Chitinophaga nivalis]MCW3488102.1 3-hydroxyacyl-CoA dehydrogenase family protein [Chitinophaga nivalis]